MFALVDCNNFYASCERVFNPKLRNRPVVILSNNEGCIIARSNEAKAIGIPMGAPFFKYKELIYSHNVFTFSSNYPLYGDLSSRVMNILSSLCPTLFVYSIDEAFLDLSFLHPHDHFSFVKMLRKRVYRWTGIPVSIGIGKTKTLAKVANKLAKTQECGFFFLSHKNLQETLHSFPIEKVWGVGARLSEALKKSGISTAWHLHEADPIFIKKKFNIQVQRSLYELQGTPCFPFSHKPSKKSILYSRAFNRAQTEFDVILEVVCHYISKLCVKLRKQQLLATFIHLFLQFKQKDKQEITGLTISLSAPSNDTSRLISAATKELPKLFQKGKYTTKVGVLLFELVPQKQRQFQLFLPENPKKEKLLQTVDAINKKLDKRALYFAAEGIQHEWKSLPKKRSPRYTTQWNELVRVR